MEEQTTPPCGRLVHTMKAGSEEIFHKPICLQQMGIEFPKYPERCYLQDHGDLVSALMLGIIGVITWLIGVMNLPTKSQ